jgi:tRNA (cmo5U34)-methyltransferase
MSADSARQDVAWQDDALVQTFLSGVRGGIPYANDQIAIMLRLLRARNLNIETFIDLGSGSGVLTHAMLREYPNSRGILIDFSEPMLDTARKELNAHAAQLQFVQADLAASDWQNALSKPVDAIVSGFAIHHLPHERKRALYAEIFSQLKSGGAFINIEHVASPTPWVSQQFDELLIDSLYALHQKNNSDKTREQVANEFVYRPDKVANILAPVETQCAWLREIGFTDVDCFFKVFELTVFGGFKA